MFKWFQRKSHANIGRVQIYHALSKTIRNQAWSDGVVMMIISRSQCDGGDDDNFKK
jgi:hypothetical protein